jgi:hypothetical protein
MFDYSIEAELFSARKQKFRRTSLAYRRFARAADAIRFAIEELPSQVLIGTYLEVDEKRYQGKDDVACMSASSIHLLAAVLRRRLDLAAA